MLAELKRNLALLSPRNARRVYGLLAFSLLNALIEVVGIGSIAPFIAVLTNPDLAISNVYLNRIYTLLGFEDVPTFLVLLGAFVVGTAIVRNVLVMWYQWLVARYTALFKHDISTRLLDVFLAQPYSFFLDASTVELQRVVVEETNSVVNGVLRPVISSFAQLLSVAAIITLVVIVNPLVAIVTLLVLAGFYWAVYRFVDIRLQTLSRERRKHRRLRFKIANEAFGAIKALILSGREGEYGAEYARASEANAFAEAKGNVMRDIPRYGIEIVAIAGLMLIVLYQSSSLEQTLSILPLVALYLLAGYRLLPALQGVYSNVTSVKFESASFETVRDYLQLDAASRQDDLAEGDDFTDCIELVDVTFSYPNAPTAAVSGLDLRIGCGQSVALVGASGAGKSTIVDLILGLLEPDSGRILVDGKPMDACRRSWQRQIGYVPQHIHLIDDSVARNIALGLPSDTIDRRAVVEAAKVAGLHTFVTGELKDGYETLVGERGIKLSGGQRQRIGLARALYGNPQVLVLDEATNALDGASEDVIMDAVQRIVGKTIILIAHRLRTVEPCDQVYVVCDGHIVDAGTYDSLAESSQSFRLLNSRIG